MATTSGTIAEAGPGPADRSMKPNRWVRVAGYTAAVLALIAASASFFIFLGLTGIEPSAEVVVWAIAINGVLLLALLAAVAWEIRRLWVARREGVAGARLHIRIVALFALVAVIPAVLVAIVANVTFAQGADHWFSDRAQEIVDTSVEVADNYYQLQLSSLGNVAAGMKSEIESQRELFAAGEWAQFQQFLNGLPAVYGVPGVFLIGPDGQAVMVDQSSVNADVPAPPITRIEEAVATAPNVVIIPPTPYTTEDGSETRAFAAAIVALDTFGDLLLYLPVGFDPQAIGYVQLANENAAAYQELQDIRSGMQLVFGLVYFGVALVVLAAAIWMGLAVANRLVSPIGRLITAADSVAKGDLDLEVPVNQSDGELATLGNSFNKMTHQLAEQRSDLVAASDQIDSRRRFIEAVLSGVTAGVLGVDAEGKITVFNRSALGLIDGQAATVIGTQIRDLVPELGPVLDSAAGDWRLEHRDQITLSRDGRSRTINVRVTTEQSSGDAVGYVITLDDITDLLTAQRLSVWADVARRIAHEIKNPLTPIQLSAERLKRRFGRVIEDDREIFDQCTDTIIRQVGDIGRMVDEFSSFARMPKPTLEAIDLRNGVKEAVFMMDVGHPEVDVSADVGDEPLIGRFDMRLISQVLTNLIKNGVEAIEAVNDPAEEKGRVRVSGYRKDGAVVVDITDNGIGLPRENRQMLLEPYMTTREKGTGLGLAIVRKIVEEHSGTIELMDAPAVRKGGHGAMVRLTFPESEAKGNTIQDTDREGDREQTKAEAAEFAPVAE